MTARQQSARTDDRSAAGTPAYRRRSMWLDLIDDPLEPRAALPGPLDVDVAIVGGGFTGLWTAYYLAKADPKLRVAVLEKEIVGFGASGRNGGWISPFFPALAGDHRQARTVARQALAMQRAMFDTVDEIGAVCAAEGIDARYHKGGVLNLATGTEQVERVRDERRLLPRLGRGRGRGHVARRRRGARAHQRSPAVSAPCTSSTAPASIRRAWCAGWRAWSRSSAWRSTSRRRC